MEFIGCKWIEHCSHPTLKDWQMNIYQAQHGTSQSGCGECREMGYPLVLKHGNGKSLIYFSHI